MTVFRYNPNIYIGSLAQAAVDRAVAHAAREFPREACGAIIGDNYHEFVNVAAEPEREFEITDPAWYEAYVAGEVDCLVHSHNDFNKASLLDQQQQQELGIPSLIINLKNRSLMDCVVMGERRHAPLIGRPFFYGVFDCLALASDYLLDNYGVALPNPPHEWEFWAAGEPVIETVIASDQELPFRAVTDNQTRIGDVLLYTIGGTRYCNHLGVVCGERGEVLHHYLNRVSGVFPLSHNRQYLRTVMRLEK